jgi:Ca2+:H+ antiporter
MCFFAGGLRFHEQGYGIRAAQLNISLLGITVIAIVLPSAFHIAQGGAVFINPKGEEPASILSISRGIAFLLLFVYVGYLTFQLYTHAYLFKTVTPFQRRKMEAKLDETAPSPPGSHVFRLPDWVPSIGGSSSSGSSAGSLSRRNSDATVDLEAGPTQTTVVPSSQEEEEEELEVPKLTRLQAAVALGVVTVLTGIVRPTSNILPQIPHS